MQELHCQDARVLEGFVFGAEPVSRLISKVTTLVFSCRVSSTDLEYEMKQMMGLPQTKQQYQECPLNLQEQQNPT